MSVVAGPAPRPHVRREGRGWQLPRADWLLVGAVAVLIAIGAASLYAATRNHLMAQGKSGTAYLDRDLVNLALGLGLAWFAVRFDYRQLSVWAPVLYGGLVFLLLAVLSPLGITVNGAHGWFALGPLQLEPSEFMKLGVIVLVAAMLSGRRDPDKPPTRNEVLLGLLGIGLPMLLVLAEPALGIALVLAVIGVTLLALGGAGARWTFGLLAGAVLLGFLAFSLHLLKPYQEQRFTYLNNPRPSSTSTGYQINQSEIAIGSGGVIGQGFLAGSQTDGGFIPEQQTDFIFTVSAEEGGLLAGVVLLGALGTVLLRGLAIAANASDPFGRLLAGGIVAWLAFQSFVNIGMTLGIMPVTGLPLPFVSYGGSSLFANLLAVALLLNVDRRTR